MIACVCFQSPHLPASDAATPLHLRRRNGREKISDVQSKWRFVTRSGIIANIQRGGGEENKLRCDNLWSLQPNVAANSAMQLVQATHSSLLLNTSTHQSILGNSQVFSIFHLIYRCPWTPLRCLEIHPQVVQAGDFVTFRNAVSRRFTETDPSERGLLQKKKKKRTGKKNSSREWTFPGEDCFWRETKTKKLVLLIIEKKKKKHQQPSKQEKCFHAVMGVSSQFWKSITFRLGA